MSEQAWRDFYFHTRDGLKLYVRDYGDRTARATPLLCLAGLTRNSRDFHDIALHLSTAAKTPRRVVCLDYRGRGKSAWDKNWRNYSPLVEAQDVFDLMAAAGLDHVAILGTSRGGIIAMIMGVMRPAQIAGVALNDVGPKLGAKGLARIKGYVGRTAAPASWRDAVRLIKSMNEGQFTALDEDGWMDFARRTFEERKGKLVLSYDPALSKPLEELDLGERMPTLWPQFHTLKHARLMVLRGEHSDLLTVDTVDAMRHDRPDMVSITVPGEGHAPLLRDEATIRAIEKFLETVDNPPKKLSASGAG